MNNYDTVVLCYYGAPIWMQSYINWWMFYMFNMCNYIWYVGICISANHLNLLLFTIRIMECLIHNTANPYLILCALFRCTHYMSFKAASSWLTHRSRLHRDSPRSQNIAATNLHWLSCKHVTNTVTHPIILYLVPIEFTSCLYWC